MQAASWQDIRVPHVQFENFKLYPVTLEQMYAGRQQPVNTQRTVLILWGFFRVERAIIQFDNLVIRRSIHYQYILDVLSIAPWWAGDEHHGIQGVQITLEHPKVVIRKQPPVLVSAANRNVDMHTRAIERNKYRWPVVIDSTVDFHILNHLGSSNGMRRT